MRNRFVLTKTARWSLLALVVLVAAGCGGGSTESKVADRYGGTVRDCRAVGLVDGDKIYSCQTDRSTVCVVVDGDDVFDATAKAQEAGLSC